MSWLTILSVLLVVLLVSFVILYKILMSPHLKYHSVWYKIKSSLIFWLGDIRRIHGFPWVTWSKTEHQLSHKQIRQGANVCRPGDVCLHRDSGYLSNFGIPGAFKHAWIIIDNEDCVEAVSEGVIRRDCMAPLITDYAVILRPIGTNKAEVDRAVQRAKAIVGCDYDANFHFNLEQADANIVVQERSFVRNLDAGGFHAAFACTEVAGFSWFHCRDKLRIFRSKYAGREAIIADDFLRMNFGIVWLSPSVTVEWAEKAGMSEEGRKKIQDFLGGNRDFNEHGNPIPRRR